MHTERAIECLESLPNLSDLSIDGNPVSASVDFKYNLILRIRKLTLLDEEQVEELDRDVAEQFFIKNHMKLPKKKEKEEQEEVRQN
mmetsp:Transcript_28176/g.21071  ORF Transcript_28176/g.21071 Transcript_28176/m.21071 type:complete len:86 (-) Transcript_28176:761-1018(-)